MKSIDPAELTPEKMVLCLQLFSEHMAASNIAKARAAAALLAPDADNQKILAAWSQFDQGLYQFFEDQLSNIIENGRFDSAMAGLLETIEAEMSRAFPPTTTTKQ